MKRTKFSLLLVVSLFILQACSSAPKKNEYVEDKVIGRIDNKSERAEWATESVSVREKGDNVEFIGAAEVPGDSRVQAAFKLSDANARGNIAGKIETNITKIVQASETGLSMESQQLNSMITEISQTSLKNVDVKDRYWEKVLSTDSQGTQTVKMKVFSLISIPKQQMQTMVIQATKTSAAPTDVRNKVEDLVRTQWPTSY